MDVGPSGVVDPYSMFAPSPEPVDDWISVSFGSPQSPEWHPDIDVNMVVALEPCDAGAMADDEKSSSSSDNSSSGNVVVVSDDSWLSDESWSWYEPDPISVNSSPRSAVSVISVDSSLDVDGPSGVQAPPPPVDLDWDL